MCSVVILLRPGHDWPVILGANRDEMKSRPWAPPARHWPDRPDVVAGIDKLAGGSWMGLNDHGLVAAIMNRMNSLGPAAGKRSRGELVLEALDQADARAAAGFLTDLDPEAYRPFNLVLADNRDAFWLRNLGSREEGRGVTVERIPPGVSMLTAHDRNDRAHSKRIAHFLPQFEQAPVPDPTASDWQGWEALLKDRTPAPGGTVYDAMCILGENGFETVSSSLLALPKAGLDRRAIWRFAAGRPDLLPYENLSF
jgi:uncharacterized protein with NRDE domain